jgi:hypothetical protein
MLQIVASLTIVIYNRNSFIKQATGTTGDWVQLGSEEMDESKLVSISPTFYE